jgi:hypothetical protein
MALERIQMKAVQVERKGLRPDGFLPSAKPIVERESKTRKSVSRQTATIRSPVRWVLRDQPNYLESRKWRTVSRRP